MSDETPEPRTPAEVRLAQLLELLAVTPAADAEFAGPRRASCAPAARRRGPDARGRRIRRRHRRHGARVIVGLTPLDPRR